jgi:molecular chaperone DnaJ
VALSAPLDSHSISRKILPMSNNYYETLDIDKSASADEIKKAFRKKAQQYHPDKKGGDEKKFKEANEAYTVLSNPQKKTQYDQFGSADAGAGFGGGGGGGFGGGFGGFQGGGGQNVEFDMNDIFESFFGGGRRQRTPRGRDIYLDVDIEFKDLIFGIKKEIKFTRDANKSDEEMTVTIPAGIDSGEMLRVRDKGEPVEGGNPGDLYIRVHTKMPKDTQKMGQNIIQLLTISAPEAILGGKKEITFLEEKLTVKIPSGITHGNMLRVKGKGIEMRNGVRGDLMLQIDIDIPKKVSKKAKGLLEDLLKELS